jgi:hypothetical protein
LVALFAGALDTRIDRTVVAGAFGPRENGWAEPFYRNVFGLLDQFGGAEIASLVAPRALEVIAVPGRRRAGAPSRGRSRGRLPQRPGPRPPALPP